MPTITGKLRIKGATTMGNGGGPAPSYTFKTSRTVGETILLKVISTSTGFWKYNHNGSDSSVFSGGNQTVTITNANGEFTLIPCLSDGTPSGNITNLNLVENQLTSFNGTGLTSLTHLYLNSNQLTSFNGTGLTSLTHLYLNSNQLTSFNGTGLTSLDTLNLVENQLTSFNGTGLTSLTTLNLAYNQLTSFNGTGLTSLVTLNLMENNLTSLDVSPMITSLMGLSLAAPYDPEVNNNLMTAASNDSILNQLATTSNVSGYFYTSGGRTSASSASYTTLTNKGWYITGADLV